MYWEPLSFFQEVIKQISTYRYEQRHRNFNQSPPGLEQPRDGGQFAKGAEAAGHQVELVSLRGKGYPSSN